MSKNKPFEYEVKPRHKIYRMLGIPPFKNGIKPLCRMFEGGNVIVTGVKGSGKDVMFGNVIARINRPYVSNMDYTKNGYKLPLNLDLLDVGKNSFKNFIADDVNAYDYPYGDKMHIYISDAGNYFPSQYCGELDRDYKYLPTLFSLVRQLGEANIHCNTQAYGRVWNKLREQADDNFIRCDKCVVIFGYAIATYYYYDKAISCENRVKPFAMKLPLFANADQRLLFEAQKEKFRNMHGTVEKRFYICKNLSKHDSRLFKEILKNGKKRKKQNKVNRQGNEGKS